MSSSESDLDALGMGHLRGSLDSQRESNTVLQVLRKALLPVSIV